MSACGARSTWRLVPPASFSRAGAHCSTARCLAPSVPWGWTARSPRARRWPGQLARWANGHPDLWQSRPVKGDVGIVFVQESMDFASIQGSGGGSGNSCAQSLQGAYQAFFDSNIQADFVSIDDIGDYPLIYLPYPEMIRQATADKLPRLCRPGRKIGQRRLPRIFRRRRPGPAPSSPISVSTRCSAPARRMSSSLPIC